MSRRRSLTTTGSSRATTVRRRPEAWKSSMTSQITPTTARITPIVWMEMPASVASTASHRTRPMAMSAMGGPVSIMAAACPTPAPGETRVDERRTGRAGTVPRMSDHVYKSVEITGSSPEGVTQAIDRAIAKASESLRNLDWFEVESIRGVLADGAVAHYQVTLKVGFRLED